MLVYLIKNNLNNKQYIGQTTGSLKERWSNHCRPSSTYCRLLHNAIKKYGKDNFSISAIGTESSLEALNLLEEKLIRDYGTLSPRGYNLLRGGFNKKHHPETIRKMSASRTGKKVPKLQVPRGPRPPSVGINISQVKKGRPNGLLGTKRKYNPNMKRRKPVESTDSLGNKERYGSTIEASRALGVWHANITACLKGRRNLCADRTWKYYESQN